MAAMVGEGKAAVGTDSLSLQGAAEGAVRGAGGGQREGGKDLTLPG